MELRSYLQAIRKHWVLITVLTLLGAAGAAAAYALTPPTFSSTVTFYVSTPLVEGTNPLAAGQFAQARVNSYVSVLQSEDLALRVIRNQRLDMGPDELSKEITATAELNTVLVTAEIRDRSPDRSLAIARGIAGTFGGMVDELDNQGRKNQVVVINVISGPTLAADPVAPSLRRNGVLGVLLGLGLGLLIAVLRDLLDMTVRAGDTAADLVGAPVLGMIDYDPQSKRRPLILRDATYSVRAEAYRQLRTNLQFISATRSADVLVVTSSLPGEGKSVTAANLAQSFVELGDRVLLVEADLRRPKLSNYLGLENAAGLTNVLVGQVAVAEVIQAWGPDGLQVLSSGPLPPNPSELLGGQQMSELIAKLRPEFDKIIIDTPPLLPVTDAAVLSATADGVLLVVRWGKTHRAQVSSAAESLRKVNASLIGCVVNMRRVSWGSRRRYAAQAYYGAASPAAWEPEPV